MTGTGYVPGELAGWVVFLAVLAMCIVLANLNDRRRTTPSCGCTHNSIRNSDPFGCYCQCDPEHDHGCDHYRAKAVRHGR